jgi:(2R)-sulfolactate sulfo-lyase subunit beta
MLAVIVLVIKITGNPNYGRAHRRRCLWDWTEMTLSEARDSLIDSLHRTANGRLTAAEALGHREFR